MASVGCRTESGARRSELSLSQREEERLKTHARITRTLTRKHACPPLRSCNPTHVRAAATFPTSTNTRLGLSLSGYHHEQHHMPNRDGPDGSERYLQTRRGETENVCKDNTDANTETRLPSALRSCIGSYTHMRLNTLYLRLEDMAPS